MSLDFWKQFWPVAHRKGIPNWLDWSHVLGGCFGAAISITNNSLGEGQWWGVGTWLYHCLWRTETKTEYRIDIGEISRIWILAVHWFIQQIFIKYLLCAWHPFWAKETPGWTQQIRKGPSSLWSSLFYTKLLFTRILWIFSCPRFSATENICSVSGIFSL